MTEIPDIKMGKYILTKKPMLPDGTVVNHFVCTCDECKAKYDDKPTPVIPDH